MAGAKLSYFDASGKKLGTKKAAEEMFAAEVSPAVLHEVVRWQRNKQRKGTHTVLTRSEVRGGGAKPWRQKGTGRARAGSNSSPVWVGGGVAHGPKQRDYTFRLNSKLRRKAICGAMSARAAENKCLVVKEFGLSEPKSKEAAAVLASLGIERGRRALVVVSAEDEVSRKSLRNLPGVRVLSAEGLNVFDVLKCEYLVFTEAGLEGVQARMGAA